MSDKTQDTAIIVYPERNWAEAALAELHGLEEKGVLNIVDAAVIVRRERDGKLQLVKKKSSTGKGVAKGGLIGLLLAVVVGGPVGVLAGAGAIVGGLFGRKHAHSADELKQLLDEKLDNQSSALAVVIDSADWQTVYDHGIRHGGEIVRLQLSAESRTQLEEIAEDPDVLAATAAQIEVE